MSRLILASGSPRRKQILGFYTLPFEVIASDFSEESIPFEGDPILYAKKLAQGKAGTVAKLHPEALVLGADTIVHLEGKIYGKPNSNDEAIGMLRELAGSTHSVFTALCAQKGEKQFSVYEETLVTFHELTDPQMHLYHQAFHGLDKAAGYGIQEGGSLIVKRIEGDFFNVMGLPLSALREALLYFDIDLWRHLK